MAADYAQRAATALNLLIPGPHRDKLIARKFGISPSTAKLLRRGKRWTAERLSQASSVLGDAFDVALSKPATNWQHNLEMQEIETRLARLEENVAQMARGDITRLASSASASSNNDSGGLAENNLREPAEG